jgi:tRNA A-37 threonylcarbamoyl transferase component Bud32
MAPDVLGNRYEIGRLIGRGAMTRVLQAWDRREHRLVAVKVLSGRLAADTALLERFAHQAQRAASLTHPNIAAVHGVGGDSRSRFVVTELVAGSSLDEMVAHRGPLPPIGAARVAAEVCAALAAAHGRGVAHGHLTPANILLAVDGQVKVTDFGLAQAARSSGPAGDPAADLQGVGRCLAAMLTGREPITDAPIGLDPKMPAQLTAIVHRTAGDPNIAYRSAAELGQDLDRFLGSIHHGTAPAGQPDLAPRDDPSAVAALASRPATHLIPLKRAQPLDRRAAPDLRPPPARRRRRWSLTAGLIGVGLGMIGLVGLVGRQPAGPVSSQAFPPASTVSLATTTSQPTTSRAPATTASPSTTGTGRTSPPATGRQTTTSRPVVGSGQRIVPNVVGLHRQQAANMLALAGLGTRILPMQVSDAKNVQRVIAQQPTAGQVLPAGSAVTVLVGTRKPTA